MSDAGPNSQRRYRRRILGWGLLVLVVTFVIGAIFLVPWTQNDLENRVGDELSDAGVEGVTVEFSGQDGTLTCSTPLGDPGAVEAVAQDVYGVRVVELDDTCIDADGADDAVVNPTPDTDPTPASTEPPVTEPPAETTTSEAPPSTEAEMETIAQLAASDPQFSQLASLLAQTGLDETLAGDGPFTVFAPTDDAFDAAFEAVGADAFEALTSDPDRLRDVLLHHVTDGAVASDSLEAGSLTMLDGTAVEIDVDTDAGVTITSGDVVATPADPALIDIEASNGIIHAIDQVLFPAGFVVEEPTEPIAQAETGAVLANGQITLTGTVQSEEQREALVAAAQGQVAAGNVIDQLLVDDAIPVADDDLDRLAQTIGAMPPNLVSGSATLSGSSLAVSGVYLSDDANAALEALGADLGADLDLSPRADADAAGAQELQDELNEFVRLNPLLFEPNSAALTADADAIVDQVAARAQRFSGVTISIIGHTDSDGDSAGNQVLSQGRAATVLDELVARGLDAATLTAEGRGDTEPILDDAGTEDKAASRRVEFVVEAAS